jgi:hypothetical protein
LPGFASASVVVKERLRVYGPLPLVIEKLQGFVSDHQAQVLRAQQDQVELELEHRPIGMRRRTDRPITFHIQLRLQEISGNNPPSNPRLPSGANKAGEILPHSSCNSGEQTPNFSATKYTTIHVEICPASSRERRRQEIAARARNVLESLRAYLMAQPEPTAEAAPRTSSRRWLPWPRFSS